MLKFMRTHATSWIIKSLLIVIILVFVLWGMGSIRGNREAIVAKVGDAYVSRSEFERAYQAMLNNYREALGDRLTPELLKRLNLKGQVLDRLIDGALIEQGGEKIGLRVGNKELMDTITHNPSFQRNGIFDRSLYEGFLGTIGIDHPYFLALLQRGLIDQRVTSFIRDLAAIVAEEEARAIYAAERGRINLSFVAVPPEAFVKSVRWTDGDLERYYAEHKEEYRAPAQVRFIYLRLSPKSYLDQVRVSSQEVEEYYAQNRGNYQRPEQVRLRHILIRVAPGAHPDVEGKARARAQDVLSKAKGGEDFAQLARRYSEDATATKGGDLGLVSRADIDPTIGRVAFSLRKGEIGPIVRSNYGFHILKVEERREGMERPLSEVREEIAALLKRQKAKERAAMEAADASYQARNKGGLKVVAEGRRLKVAYGGPCVAGKVAGDMERLAAVAFTLEEKGVSSPFQAGDDYIVLEVVEKIPPRPLPLAQVREKVKGAFVASRAKELAGTAARELLAAWKKGEGFGELLRRYGLRVEETGYFPKNSTPPRIGHLGAFSLQAATLTMNSPWLEEVVEAGNSFFVIKLQGVEEVDDKLFKGERDQFVKRLAEYKGVVLKQGWLAATKKTVEVKVNQELLEGYR